MLIRYLRLGLACLLMLAAGHAMGTIHGSAHGQGATVAGSCGYVCVFDDGNDAG